MQGSTFLDSFFLGSFDAAASMGGYHISNNRSKHCEYRCMHSDSHTDPQQDPSDISLAECRTTGVYQEHLGSLASISPARQPNSTAVSAQASKMFP